MIRAPSSASMPPAVSAALLYEIAARVLAEISPCTCEPIAPSSAVPLSGWQGVIEFRGPTCGRVGLRVPRGYARVLAASMAGDEVRDDPGMQADAVGESANILSSSVLAILFGTRRQVRISSPIVSGDSSGFPAEDSDGLVMLGLLVDREHVVQVWVQGTASSRLGGLL